MARMSKEDRFELRTQNRRAAVKHMKARLTVLRREHSALTSFKAQDAVALKINFLSDVIDRTLANLNPKRKVAVTSLADHAEAHSDESVHLYNNTRSSFAGVETMMSAAS